MNKRRRYGFIFFTWLAFVGVSLACGITFDRAGFLNQEPTPAAGDPVMVPTVVGMIAPTLTASADDLEAGAREENELESASTSPQFSQAASTPDLLTLFIDLYEQVQPAVVSISSVVTQGGQPSLTAGSGFILDHEGHIITNHHVVVNSEELIVTFWNGVEAQAEVIGTDAESDLAVIQVDQFPEGVRLIAVGDSDQVRVGEWVVAIGNPFGVGTSMSVGIVSAVGRIIASGQTPFSIPEAIQTDAAMNPGNSGGPLLNLKGEVIGVNAQIATAGAVPANSGVGFAIPVNVVRRVAPALIDQGAYQWPWLGVEGDSLNLAYMQANRLDNQAGAYILRVIPGSPAELAGLRGASGVANPGNIPSGGDIVIAADGQPVNNWADLLVNIAAKSPGDTIRLTVVRSGELLDIAVTLVPRPENINTLP